MSTARRPHVNVWLASLALMRNSDEVFPRPRNPVTALIASLTNLRLRRNENAPDDPFERYTSALGVDSLFANEIAQFHTFGIPEVSSLLHQTGQYENDGVRRLDDTKALMTSPLSEGATSTNGQAALRQVNRIHGQYDIDNDEFLYVLSTFVFATEYWSGRYAWREADIPEAESGYARIIEVGRHMGIRNIPDDVDQFRMWVNEYVSRKRRFHPDNHAVAEGMMRGVKAMVPAPLRPIISPLTRVWIGDPDLLAALGYTLPPRPFVWLVNTAMTIRKTFLRRFTTMNNRRFADLFLATSLPSRPNGFASFTDLGPQAVRDKFAEQGAR